MSGPWVVLLGRHGAGKTTLRMALQRRYPHAAFFAVRPYFRRQVELGSGPAATHGISICDSDWLPDSVVNDAVEGLFTAGAFDEGFIFESFPGTVVQAEKLESLLARSGLRPTVVHLDAPPAECRRRVRARLVCAGCGGGKESAQEDPRAAGHCARCGQRLRRRADDSRGAFARRSQRHWTRLAPILAHYRRSGCLTEIDAIMPAAQVLASVVHLLEGERSDQPAMGR